MGEWQCGMGDCVVDHLQKIKCATLTYTQFSWDFPLFNSMRLKYPEALLLKVSRNQKHQYYFAVLEI